MYDTINEIQPDIKKFYFTKRSALINDNFWGCIDFIFSCKRAVSIFVCIPSTHPYSVCSWYAPSTLRHYVSCRGAMEKALSCHITLKWDCGDWGEKESFFVLCDRAKCLLIEENTVEAIKWWTFSFMRKLLCSKMSMKMNFTEWYRDDLGYWRRLAIFLFYFWV
jgi:hypothetical protein